MLDNRANIVQNLLEEPFQKVVALIDACVGGIKNSEVLAGRQLDASLELDPNQL